MYRGETWWGSADTEFGLVSRVFFSSVWLRAARGAARDPFEPGVAWGVMRHRETPSANCWWRWTGLEPASPPA